MKLKVWAPQASQVWFCIFDEAGHETRHELIERDGEYWVGDIADVQGGDRYGLRAAGDGGVFNQDKLLIDPQAQHLEAPLTWHPLMSGETAGDSAPVMPKCIVPFAPADDLDPATNRPAHVWEDTVIYEAHVKGLTQQHPDIPESICGSYAALGHPALISHLKHLGVTALELLPVQAFIDDQYLVERHLTNYWGYQPIAFSALEPRYASTATGAQADTEFRQAVHTLHENGIEVLLDVVFNHSGEGSGQGPTLSMRGLNDAGYYVRNEDGSYNNDAGTGNVLAVRNPPVLQLVLDSLRHFAQRYGVDGFRFDLASALGRTASGFTPHAAFFQALAQDPVLKDLKMIAEPWDIGPGGYQLGAFPHPWREWNDTYRDRVRQAWRRDPDRLGPLASATLGSALQFDHSSRPATSSINFLSAHDGFTLRDTVSYSQKHNEANGEDNRDGHNENYSDNLGVEGPTDDAQINLARTRRIRAMLATLFLSQGVPMLLAGDEMGNSQQGNNNAYCQDNDLTWLNWADADTHLIDYVAALTELRRRFPQLRRSNFMHGEQVRWWTAEATPAQDADWHDPATQCFQMQLENLLVVYNTGDEIDITLPVHPEGRPWNLEFESYEGAPQSVRVYS
ncbi:MAG: glycogen debranching protein GlgX [Rothia sp. (in: high G+C Gram-positive bacteria)]|nr:glycogen debranching protein GlgX [Rothia sp. (in: high G+C Gram-positive bacteria)]